MIKFSQLLNIKCRERERAILRNKMPNKADPHQGNSKLSIYVGNV